MASNGEFIEVLSSSAISDIEKINAEIDILIQNINKASAASKNLRLPSEYKANFKVISESSAQANSIMQSQISLIEKLNASKQKIDNSTRKYNQSTSAEIVNNRILRQNADRLALANSTLASEYQKLSARQAESARQVQNLVARGRLAEQSQRQYNSELKKAQNEFNKLNQRVLLADRAIGRFNRNVGNYPMRAISGIRDLMGAFGVVGGVMAFASITKGIFNITKELQALDLAQKQVIGNDKELAITQTFLTQTAEAYGVEIGQLTKSYTQFYASAKDKLSGNEIRGIFDSISKAAGAMGLSVEQQEGAFLALTQMLSKGTIQAEEIRGQLSERLPGAFTILAKSMGVTEMQLNKLLKDGKVLAAEVLPAFAKELERAYGIENLTRVETLSAETTRLSNAWKDLVRTLNEGQGAVPRFFGSIISEITEAIKGWNKLIQTRREAYKDNENQSELAGYKLQVKELNKLEEATRKAYAPELIKNSEESIKSLEEERKAIGDNINSLNERIRNLPEKLFGLFTSEERSKLQEELKRAEKSYSDYTVKIQRYNGYIRAAEEVTNDKSSFSGEGSGKQKRQKEELDYLRQVYLLRKQEMDNFIEYEGRIMNDEERNYADRLAAAENYYFQKQKLLELEYKEQTRVNQFELEQKEKQYEYDISQGTRTQSDLDNIRYESMLKQQRFHEEFIFRQSELEVEQAKKLQGVLEAITKQRFENKLSKQEVDDLRQMGLILDNVGTETSLAQFAEIENKMRRLQESENARKEESLQYDIRALETQKKEVAEAQRKRVAYEQCLSAAEAEALTQEDLLKDNQEGNRITGEILSKEKELLNLRNASKEAIAEVNRQMKEATQGYLDSVISDTFGQAGLSSLSGFFDNVTYEIVNDLGEIETRTGSTFDKMMDQATTFGEKFGVAFNVVSTVIQEAYAFMNQNQQAYFDAQYVRLQREKDIAIGFAGESATAREEIERQYEERRREIAAREAKAKKEQAIFNIILNTAQGVTAALTSIPPNIPLSVLIGALGAAQVAMVQAQQIPAYKEGIMNAPGGLSLVGDGGRSEIIQLPSGGLYKTPSKDTLVDLPKGSNVYKSELDFYRNAGILNDFPHIEMTNEGLNVEDMDAIFGKYMGNISTNVFNLDKNGLETYVVRSGSKNKILNGKVKSKGLNS